MNSEHEGVCLLSSFANEGAGVKFLLFFYFFFFPTFRPFGCTHPRPQSYCKVRMSDFDQSKY